MKKLLVLSLVLGIASLATAGLVVTDSGTDINVGIDQSVLGYEFIIEVTAGDVTLDSSGVTYGFTWDFDNNPVVDTPTLFRVGGSQFMSAAQGTGDFVLGLGYEGVGEITISDAYNPNFEAVVLQVPEPATMALLGLGALVLRRKK